MPKQKYDSWKSGFLPGVIIPAISFMSFYLVRYSEIPLMEYIMFIYFRDVLSPLLSVNILPNLILFFVFIRADYLRAARGVLTATFLYAFLVLVFKLLI
jgi:hypothetical protein